MRLSVKTKEALGVTLLTFLVVSAATLIHLFQLTGVILQELAHEAELIEKQIFDRSRHALARGLGPTPQDRLRTDRELQRFLEASVGYSPHLLYALIADLEGRTVLHSEPGKDGDAVAGRRGLDDLLALGPVRRTVALYKGGTIYESRLPISLNGKPFGSVRLGIHTSLLKGELLASLRKSATFAAIALPVAWLLTMGLATVTLRPIHALARQMERLRQGDFEAVTDLSRTDEFRDLAAQVQLLGQQLKSDRVKTQSDKAQVQSLVDQLADGVMLIDHERRIVFCNRGIEAIAGRPVELLTGCLVSEVAPADHPLRRVLDDLFDQDLSAVKTTLSHTSDGRTREYVVSAFPLREGQPPTGAVLLLKDVESIKTVQSLIRYSAKLTALGRLTSGVAHEVKNPLNAMAIHLELLKGELGVTSETAQQSLEVIECEIRRLDRVVQGFLRFMRPRELHLAQVDLHRLLEHSLSLLEAEWGAKQVRFASYLASSPLTITGDGELLSQVFLNILLNACQAMPGGGTVTVATAQEGHDVVRISVSDEGTGIPEEDRDKIFNLYYTTKPDGSGMGLPLAYRIVQLHDGTIEVLSKVGEGTVIIVRLPVRQ